jgi:pimeloyl-ACP methyl ester carboxylesterase
MNRLLIISLLFATRFPMLSPCPSMPDALCGTIEVPENRAVQGGRKIPLQVAVIPATDPEPATDALLAITGGGPGVASIPDAASFAKAFPQLHASRDMIFVDQRGTGGSNPLDCPLGADAIPALLGGALPAGKVAECRTLLAKTNDLAAYTTAAAADDLDDVRAWLGLDRVNVYGSSYASRLALAYAQRHGGHVRTLTTKAAIPPSFRNPLYSARDAQDALDRLFTDCAADTTCAAAYPKLRGDFETVLARLAHEPARVGEAEVTRDVFAGVIRRMLYTAEGQRSIPLVITAAARGDFAGIKNILGVAGFIDKVLNLGLFLSVTCAEDVAFFDDAVAKETKGTFTGPVLASSLKRACAGWPVTKVDPSAAKIVRGVPALVISGTLDPDAGPRWGRAMVRLIDGARGIEAEGMAHSGMPKCIAATVEAFIAAGSMKGVDVSCVAAMNRQPFVYP